MYFRNVFFCFFMILSCSLIFSFKVDANSEKTIPFIDHADDPEKAKAWAEDYYSSWEKKLAPEEKKSLLKLLEPIDFQSEKNNIEHINRQLQVYGGDLTARPIDIPDKNKTLTDHVERITLAINRKEGVLDKPLIVYKNENPYFTFGLFMDDLVKEDNTIDQQKVKQLRSEFLYAQKSEFNQFDLFEDSQKNQMVKWKIEIPAGTPTGLIDKDKIVLNKSSAFEITGMKIITKKGKQHIRIEAKLVPKEIVENEIKQITEKTRQDFIKDLQLPQDKKIINFKLTGGTSFILAKKLTKLLNTFTTTIGAPVISKVLPFMADKEGYMLWTDQTIYALPRIFEPSQRTEDLVLFMLDAKGIYNAHNSILFLDILFSHEFEEIDPYTLIHEFGHAVDHYAGVVYKTGYLQISFTPEFKKIFAQEGQNLTDYGTNNSHEFFAEAFRMIHTPEQEDMVKQNAPKAYSFIENVLDRISDPQPKSLKKTA